MNDSSHRLSSHVRLQQATNGLKIAIRPLPSLLKSFSLPFLASRQSSPSNIRPRAICNKSTTRMDCQSKSSLSAALESVADHPTPGMSCEKNAHSLTSISGRTFYVNDKVVIHKPPNEVKMMSEGHGGWLDSMADYCTKVGIIHRFTEAGDVRVKFGLEPSAPRFTFNPECLTTIYFVGDIVETLPEMSEIVKVQRCNSDATPLDEACKRGVDISKKTTKVLAVSRHCHMALVCIDDECYWLSFRVLILRVHNGELLTKCIGQVDSLYDNDTLITPGMWEPPQCVKCKMDVWRRSYQDLMDTQTCQLCFEEWNRVVFACGHRSCEKCALAMECCPFCRKPITPQIMIY